MRLLALQALMVLMLVMMILLFQVKETMLLANQEHKETLAKLEERFFEEKVLANFSIARQVNYRFFHFIILYSTYLRYLQCCSQTKGVICKRYEGYLYPTFYWRVVRVL